MAGNTNPVSGDGTSAPVEPQSSTPSAGGVAQTTPANQPTDAETLAAKLAQTQADLNRMKSTFQRRETELSKALEEQRNKAQQELDAVRRSLLDDDDLQQYEREFTQTKLVEMQNRLASAESALQAERNLREAVSAFATYGVPMNLLQDAAQDGLEALSTTAWNWLIEDRNRLQQATLSQQPPQQKTNTPATPPPPAPPPTDTNTGSPYSGATWGDLIKRYGSAEAVFTLVEAGRLPADILPFTKEE